MRVAFRVDASARIGGGHVMRCLTLADELKGRGAETMLVAAAMPPPLADRVIASGHGLHIIAAPDGLDRTGEDWDSQPLSAEVQRGDARRSREVIGQRADWIVVDHYLLGAEWHRAARPAAQRLMVVDDLANRPLECDLLLDQTLSRTDRDYKGLVPREATRLLGARYALLRPEFARERQRALARRHDRGQVQRILLSLGTTDIGGVTGKVLEAILPVTTAQAIDVVIGAEAESLDHVRALAKANSNVCIHLDAPNMAELMRDVDLAIGAAGTTSWERCCLGLPAVIVILARNQANAAHHLAAAGAVLLADLEPAQIAQAVRQSIERPDALATMSLAAAKMCDGCGTDLVVDQLQNYA